MALQSIEKHCDVTQEQRPVPFLVGNKPRGVAPIRLEVAIHKEVTETTFRGSRMVG